MRPAARPARTSSAMTPRPPLSVRSHHPIMLGLAISNMRNTPNTTPATHQTAGTKAKANHKPATSSATICGSSCNFERRRNRAQTHQLMRPYAIAIQIWTCAGKPLKPHHQITNAANDPHVPGAGRNSPAPPKVSHNTDGRHRFIKLSVEVLVTTRLYTPAVKTYAMSAGKFANA